MKIPKRYHPLGLRIFQTTHRSIILLCLSDAIVGAAMASPWHHPYLGAYVGGWIGILNYYIVNRTVFRRVLKP